MIFDQFLDVWRSLGWKIGQKLAKYYRNKAKISENQVYGHSVRPDTSPMAINGEI